MKNYSLLIMGGSNGDEDDSGGNSLSQQGAEIGTFVPRIRVFGGGGAEKIRVYVVNSRRVYDDQDSIQGLI